jgi:hypothetical protein
MTDLRAGGGDCARSVEATQQFLEMPVARLRRRRLERAAKGGSDARLRRGHVHLDDLPIHHVRFRRGFSLSLELHRQCKRPMAYGSFVGIDSETVNKGL